MTLAGSSTAVFAVRNPSTGALVAEVADHGAAEALAAVERGHAIAGDWAGLPGRDRARILRRAHALLERDAADVARTLAAESGKSLAEARAEHAFGAGFFEWFAGEAERIYGHVVPPTDPRKRLLVLRQPIGLVAAITPWNFPLAMVTRKLGAALAAGCPVILKPSEETPLTALRVAALLEEAGLPPGVVQVLTARDPEPVGRVLATDPRVAAITFTGSTAVGKRLLELAAPTVKRVGLELGGNAPFIVFDDAALAVAVDQLVAGKFRCAGQVCVAPNRILVQEGIHDRFVAALAERVRALRIGDGNADGDVDMGSLINEDAVAKCRRHVDDAVARGATIVAQAQIPEGPCWFAPTLLTGVDDSMLVFREETFGPVASVGSFRTEEEAMARANEGVTGLAAYVCTTDPDRMLRVPERIRAGVVGVNDGVTATPVAPFGGFGESGLGREGGDEGIAEFLESKFLSFGPSGVG